MHITYLSVFAVLLAIPCIVALTRSKEASTRTLLGITAAIGGFLALVPVVDFIGDLVNGHLLEALGAIAAVLAVIVTIRVQQPAIAALCCTSGLLIAAEVFGILH